MSDYSKIVDYATKDALVSGDPNKVVRGTELDAEFVAIQTMSGTKADKAGPTFTGTTTVAALTVSGATTVVDGNFNITGSSDASKKVKFEVDGLTTATTRTVTIPDRDITLNTLTSLSASLGADVNLNNTGSYFDGPSVAQGTSGTWLVIGTVTVGDTASADIYAKLWDGTTVIDSAQSIVPSANVRTSITLVGVITSPAGNLKISVRDPGTVNGKIYFNQSGNSKDSSIVAVRIG